MAQIDLACGPYRIVSLMSREAADELDLKPGDTATAMVKSTTVIIERRTPGGARSGKHETEEITP
jgi:molybdopterin-binding protein